MSFNSAAAVERQLIHLTDDELLDTIGKLWETAKRLEERMKGDSEILQLEDQIRELKHERYLDQRKAVKSRLKAARRLAEAKGLQIHLDGEF